jgi:putative tricarboxylic transport membrane protein
MPAFWCSRRWARSAPTASIFSLGGIPVSFGLGLLLLFGILGYVLRRFHYPIAPVVVGLILGPMAEKSLRQALQISQGNPMALFHSWIAVILWVLALTAVLLPLYLRYRGSKVMGQLGSGDTD